MKSTRRQDYVSKEWIFNGFKNRAAVRQTKIQLAKEFKTQREILKARKEEEANKADSVDITVSE